MLLVAVLIFSTVAYTINGKEEQKKDEKTVQVKEKQVADIKTTGSTVYIFSNDKDEVSKIIATDDILDRIKDSSLKADEKLLSLEKELPITIEPTYYLNGKKVKKQELEGKTGTLKIHYTYTNHQYETRTIQGKNEKIYVPYAMLTSCVLDNENFKDVSISSGKIIDDGNHTIILGLALPGLEENLGLGNTDIELPSSFTIQATIKNYKPVETISLATNKVFNNIEPSNELDVNGIQSSLSQLEDAMNQLISGSSQLYQGLSLLDTKSDELSNGVTALCQGSSQLSNGTAQLQEGSKKLSAGATALYDGLSTLCDNNETLQQGALEVFNTLLKTANMQLQSAGLDVKPLTVENYDAVLTDVIASLDADHLYQTVYNEVTKQVEAQRPIITQKVTAVVQEQVMQKVTYAVQEKVSAAVEEEVQKQVYAGVIKQALHMTPEQYEKAVQAKLVPKAVQNKINQTVEDMMKSDEILVKKQAVLETQMQSKEIQATIQGEVKKQMASDAMQTTIQQQTDLQVEKAITDIMASDDIQNKFKEAQEGLTSIIELKTSLNKYNVFYKGILQYTNGVAQAFDGSAQLKDGLVTLVDSSAQLHNGASQLEAGLETMKDNIPALKGGITDLKQGSKQLADGLVQFNEEGISKIINALNGDFKGLAERLQATLDVSKHHQTFAGIDQTTDQDLTFIYR